MADNEFIRRFFWRENDELTVHNTSYRPHTALVAYHALAAIIEAEDFEVSEITNFEDSFSGTERTSVTWRSCAVGFDQRREYITAGYVIGRHTGFGGLKALFSLEPGNNQIIFKVTIRSEDRSLLVPLLDWVEARIETGHPLKGRLFGLGENRLDFLPPQGVSRDDVVLPGDVLDEVERNFAFLDEPGDFPPGLRHRAILLAGQPGVGKTMIAKWLSGRFACTTLWAMPGALWELGAAAVFQLAIQLRPTLLILEDLDAAAGERRGNNPLGDLLGQMDGFSDLTDVAVIATTNCPETLDVALDPEKRPGRFHRMFNLTAPDCDGRARLLKAAVARSNVIGGMPDASFNALVESTDNRTGAQLAELVHDIESRLLWHGRRGEDFDLEKIVHSVANDRFNCNSPSFGFN